MRLLVILQALFLAVPRPSPAAELDSYRGIMPEILFNKITIDLHDVQFGTALDEISSRGGFELNYNDSRIPVGRKVSVSASDSPALKALFKILGETGTGLAVTEAGQIAVVRSNRLVASSNYHGKEMPRGTVNGTVFDMDTRAPLSGAAVAIQGTTQGAVADRNGKFTIGNVPVGTYVVRVSYTGYYRHLATDVVVKSGSYTTLNAGLKLSVFEIDSVLVEGSYFSGSEEQATSTFSFSREEIRRAPGTAGDISRTINVLPGIARTDDEDNFLVVRGGHPSENAYYVDNMQIPVISHFSDPANAGGSIGILNADFLQEMTFSAGGFSAEYGDRLSSVMELTFREGNREGFRAEAGLNLTGSSIQGEGPLVAGRGSWMFSARRSYLDLMLDMMGDGDENVRYGDYQGKVTFDINNRNKLSLVVVSGNSEEQNENTYAVAGGGGLTKWSEDTESWVSFVGLNWSSRWNGNGYSKTSISYFNQDYSEVEYDLIPAAKRLKYQEQSTDRGVQLRNVNFYRINRYLGLKFGVDAKRLRSNIDGTSYTDERLDGNLFGSFFQVNLDPARRLETSLGIRYDYFSYNRRQHFAPRLSFSWHFTDKTSLTGSAGIYNQTIPFNLLIRDDWKGKRDDLRDVRAYHYILGYNHLLTSNTKLTVEVYDKQYRNLPINEKEKLDLTPYNYEGRAYCRGVELTVQKKLACDLYGLVSATYFQSKFRNNNGIWTNRFFNNRYLFSVQGGYIASRKWEFSARYIYAGGRPYTPFGGAEAGILNTESYPAYNTLNLRMDRRFNFKRSNLVLFLDIWNIYNKQNMSSFTWTNDGQIKYIKYQWGLIPIFGLEWEF